MGKAFEIGLMTTLKQGAECIGHVAQFGLNVCQIDVLDVQLYTRKVIQKITSDAKDAGVRIAAVAPCVPAGSAQGAWDFVDGPSTLGLVPHQYRQERIEALKKGADFAKQAGASAIVVHAGFIPENPRDKDYQGTVAAIREVSSYCLKKDIEFWFETGQETPVTLMRTIEDVGLPNLGINFDPANLLMYGKANPVDAVDIYGNYVRNLHAKDGLYPTDTRKLGREVPIGTGRVNFPVLFKKLKEIGFKGEIIIEREISGQQQIKDIKNSIKYLKRILKKL